MSISRTAIVTGANTGIGFEVAKEMCRLGHDVVISVRDETKGNATVRAILAEIPESNVIFFVMDLCDPSSIRSFVEKFKATRKPLHILINNAGVFPAFRGTERMVARGDPELELSMTVNCMGTFLLTNLLLSDLKESGTPECPARIVNVSSSMTGRLNPDWKLEIDNLMLTRPNSYVCGAKAYRGSKVALNLWSNELAKQLKTTNVIVNSVCPGFIPSTDLKRHSEGSRLFMFVFTYVFDSFIGRRLFNTKPISEGRRRIIELALDDKYKTSNGAYYANGVLSDEAPDVLSPENQAKIWDLCVKYSGL